MSRPLAHCVHSFLNPPAFAGLVSLQVDTHLADSLLTASSRRLKAGWGESCLRYLKFLSFCVVCTGSLVQAVVSSSGPNFALFCLESTDFPSATRLG
jgi:hypothetical protein